MKDKLHLLAALIPSAIAFGPFFMMQDWGSWMLTLGLGMMFLYILFLHRRVQKLEEKVEGKYRDPTRRETEFSSPAGVHK